MTPPLPIQTKKSCKEGYTFSPNFWNILLTIAPMTFFVLTILCLFATSLLCAITETESFLWLPKIFAILAVIFPITSACLSYWIWRTVKTIQQDSRVKRER